MDQALSPTCTQDLTGMPGKSQHELHPQLTTFLQRIQKNILLKRHVIHFQRSALDKLQRWVLGIDTETNKMQCPLPNKVSCKGQPSLGKVPKGSDKQELWGRERGQRLNILPIINYPLVFRLGRTRKPVLPRPPSSRCFQLLYKVVPVETSLQQPSLARTNFGSCPPASLLEVKQNMDNFQPERKRVFWNEGSSSTVTCCTTRQANQRLGSGNGLHF